MEQYSDIHIWDNVGGESTVADLAATLTDLRRRVKWAKDIDEDTTKAFIDSSRDVREALSSVDVENFQLHPLVEGVGDQIDLIQQKGLNQASAEDASDAFRQLVEQHRSGGLA